MREDFTTALKKEAGNYATDARVAEYISFWEEADAVASTRSTVSSRQMTFIHRAASLRGSKSYASTKAEWNGRIASEKKLMETRLEVIEEARLAREGLGFD